MGATDSRILVLDAETSQQNRQPGKRPGLGAAAGAVLAISLLLVTSLGGLGGRHEPSTPLPPVTTVPPLSRPLAPQHNPDPSVTTPTSASPLLLPYTVLIADGVVRFRESKLTASLIRGRNPIAESWLTIDPLARIPAASFATLDARGGHAMWIGVSDGESRALHHQRIVTPLPPADVLYDATPVWSALWNPEEPGRLAAVVDGEANAQLMVFDVARSQGIESVFDLPPEPLPFASWELVAWDDWGFLLLRTAVDETGLQMPDWVTVDRDGNRLAMAAGSRVLGAGGDGIVAIIPPGRFEAEWVDLTLTTPADGPLLPDGVTHVEWLPGGAHILTTGPSGVVLHTVATEASVVLPDWPIGWAPDGSMLAFPRNDPEGWHLDVLDLATGDHSTVETGHKPLEFRFG